MEVNDELFQGIGTIGERNRRSRILELRNEIEDMKRPESKQKQTMQNSKIAKIEREIETIELESAQNREAYEILNQVGERELSLSLPIVLLVSLLAPFTLVIGPQILSQQQSGTPLPSNAMLGSFVIAVSEVAKPLSMFSSAVVCWLFSKCEIQNAISTVSASSSTSTSTSTSTTSSSSSSLLTSLSPERIGALASTLLVTLAYLHFPVYGNQLSWIAQNTVNMCIAITFARVIQIKELKWVIVAISGIALYDYFGVLGSQQLTDGGKSVMEAVARAKANLPDAPSIASSSDSKELVVSAISDTLRVNKWQPGLLQIAIDGKPSDLFGLGDMVFPSLLAGWSLRKDRKIETDSKGDIYFRSSMVSYAIGCLALELLQTGSGQPALVYLVPSMLIGLIAAISFEKKREGE